MPCFIGEWKTPHPTGHGISASLKQAWCHSRCEYAPFSSLLAWGRRHTGELSISYSLSLLSLIKLTVVTRMGIFWFNMTDGCLYMWQWRTGNKHSNPKADGAQTCYSPWLFIFPHFCITTLVKQSARTLPLQLWFPHFAASFCREFLDPNMLIFLGFPHKKTDTPKFTMNAAAPTFTTRLPQPPSGSDIRSLNRCLGSVRPKYFSLSAETVIAAVRILLPEAPFPREICYCGRYLWAVFLQ